MVHRDRGAIAGVLRALAPALALTLLSAILLCAGGAGTAQGDQLTVTSGSVNATLSWTPGIGIYTDEIRLHVERAGAVALDGAQVVGSTYAAPNANALYPPLEIVDLDGDGEPEVVVSVASGGTACCWGMRVYRWDGSTYTPSRLLAIGGLHRIAPLDDGSLGIVTATAFWQAGAHSCAGYPVEVFAYRAGTLTDVTAGNPHLVTRDAQQWKRRWPRRCGDSPAADFLAAYVVDLRRLGRTAAAERAIARARRNGYFKTSRTSPGITEHAFRRALAHFIAYLNAAPHFLTD